jgi:hypothetical protein
MNRSIRIQAAKPANTSFLEQRFNFLVGEMGRLSIRQPLVTPISDMLLCTFEFFAAKKTKKHELFQRPL